MSHRNAWGYLRELERQPGGGPRSGMRLTRQGREFLAHYRQFRQDVNAGIARQFRRASKSR
jgi:molybdenum-dependent DNA-binding transcriptional regulator ModE